MENLFTGIAVGVVGSVYALTFLAVLEKKKFDKTSIAGSIIVVAPLVITLLIMLFEVMIFETLVSISIMYGVARWFFKK
jgi:hypothetical protein